MCCFRCGCGCRCRCNHWNNGCGWGNNCWGCGNNNCGCGNNNWGFNDICAGERRQAYREGFRNGYWEGFNDARWGRPGGFPQPRQGGDGIGRNSGGCGCGN